MARKQLKGVAVAKSDRLLTTEDYPNGTLHTRLTMTGGDPTALNNDRLLANCDRTSDPRSAGHDRLFNNDRRLGGPVGEEIELDASWHLNNNNNNNQDTAQRKRTAR